MTISVIISNAFQSLTGGATRVEARGDTIAECTRSVVEQYPDLETSWFAEDGTISRLVMVSLNQKLVYGNVGDKPVNSGDVLLVMPVMAGG